MVFQSYALYPHMSVYDNMAFGLKLRKRPKPEIERRVKEAAELLGLQNLLQRKPKQLSGGQRQRVALGRAIVREPQVFLMDEPLSNLDAKLRVETRAGLIKLHQRLQTTTVYVTHDQTEAMTMGHRIAVLQGRRAAAARHAADALRPAGQHVRGGLHRQPGDELLPGPAGRRERRPGAVGPDQRPEAEAARGDARRARRRRPAARSSSACGPSTSTAKARCATPTRRARRR